MKYNTFLVSDLHFFHENVIRFDKRPFSSVYEMNETLINNWNETVNPEDKVYVLGDMFMKCTPEEAESVLKRLNGQIHYIFGNHEAPFDMKPELLKYFKSAKHYDKVQIVDKSNHTWNVILSHYPIVSYEGMQRRNTIHIYGHVHNSTEQLITEVTKLINVKTGDNPKVKKMVNAGVMMPYMNYRPQPIDTFVTQAYHENKVLYDLDIDLTELLELVKNTGLQGVDID